MRRTAAPSRVPEFVRAGLTAVLIAVVTFAVASWSLAYLVPADGGSPLWWPATGIAIVIMMRCDRRWWPLLIAAFMVGSFAASRMADDWTVTLTYLVVNTLELVIASSVLAGRGQHGRRWAATTKQAWQFVVAAVVAIGCGCVVLTLTTLMIPGTASTLDIIAGFGLSHSLGLLAVAPLLLPGHFSDPPRRWYHLEYALVVVGTVALAYWIFLQDDAAGRAFPVLVPVIWAAIRFDPLRTVVISFMTCSAAAYGVAAQTGTLADIADPIHRVSIAQLLIATLTGTALVLVLVMRHRARLAAQAQESEQTLRIAIQDSLVGMYSIRLDPGHVGEISEVNDAMLAMFGYRSGDLIGHHCRVLGARDDAEDNAVLDDILSGFLDGRRDTFHDEDAFLTCAGERLWVEFMMTAVRPGNGNAFVFVHIHDLTDREDNKLLLEKMALHDPLTGLANRALLFERLGDLLRHRAAASQVGVLFLDLNEFKAINDTFGHAAGDEVLIEVAHRLGCVVRPSDTVARLGGDEFAIVCPGLTAADSLALVAERARHALSAPFELSGGVTIAVRASIGMATDTGTVTADQLLGQADAAMYVEKRMGYDDVAT